MAQPLVTDELRADVKRRLLKRRPDGCEYPPVPDRHPFRAQVKYPVDHNAPRKGLWALHNLLAQIKNLTQCQVLAGAP